ncbi:hypothetical protein [Variovorax sp. PMC12]|uniref:hypothetical protein n=1 Tax=Variovorax sp. PMC12 TaxID=2126319 RepID=UPI000D131632|nr:hypothetical protein [Variovorax sp. PMC12]AVQ80738.1 hypothetical protein C4F17_07120 [Variovorax sp. PMC12]
MSMFKAPIDQTVDLIARGLHAEVQGLLRERLMAVAKELIEPLCKEASENLVARVHFMHRIDRSSNELVVMFNDKKVT